jgi:hypothetical protein
VIKKKSILFVNPDYHCSFLLRDELRARGWRADIFIPPGYPKKLLYKNEGITLLYTKNNRWLNIFQSFFYLVLFFFRYKYFLIYGGSNILALFDDRLRPLLRDDFCLDLSLARILRKKIMYLPSGCLEDETKANFSKLDNGNVCKNCGWSEGVCNDEMNTLHFGIKRRYGNFFFGNGTIDSTQFSHTHTKYKSIDLTLWHPHAEIPEEFNLPQTNNLRILHSFYNVDREHNDKNIKGSPFVLNAIERLKREGYQVEYFHLHNVPSRFMRYYQIQADIIVEQLIYGWWGSTGVECMALGKPVICYLRPEWKEFFLKTFGEYNSLPIIEATPPNIYEVLKELVINKEQRKQKGRESRIFAERHFDVRKNAVELERHFLSL